MKLEDLGSEWTGKVYAYWNTKHGWLSISEHPDWADDDNVLLGESDEITVPLIPRDEMIHKHVEFLRTQKQRVLAESQQRIEQIEQQIQSLLAIEHKPEVR